MTKWDPADRAEADVVYTMLGEAPDKVAKAAQSWRTVLTTLLGVFATVSFITGPGKLADLSEPLTSGSVYLIAVLTTLVLFALILAVLAGDPMANSISSAGVERTLLASARRAQRRLHDAQIMTYTAAVLVAFGAVVVLASGTRESSSDTSAAYLVVVSGGEPSCLTAQSPEDLEKLTGVRSIEPVDSCPKHPSKEGDNANVDRAVPLAVFAVAITGLVAWSAYSLIVARDETATFRRDRPLVNNRARTIMRTVSWTLFVLLTALVPVSAEWAIRAEAWKLDSGDAIVIWVVAAAVACLAGDLLAQAYPTTSLWRPHPVARNTGWPEAS